MSSRGVPQKVEVRWKWSRTHGKCTGKYDAEADCDGRKVAGWIGK